LNEFERFGEWKMKTRLWLTALTIALVFNAVMTRARVEGEAPGIRKEHLDPTPGAFVDNTTIEIGASGLQITSQAVTPAKIDTIFGGWMSQDTNQNPMVANATYLAPSDGFVCVYGVGSHGGGGVRIVTDSSDSPTTARVGEGAGYVDYRHGASCPVIKGDYFRVEPSGNWDATPDIYWLPIGSQACIRQ